MAYPSSIETFTRKVDLRDRYRAADINELQSVAEKIQTELGTDPAGLAADVKTRLANSLPYNIKDYGAVGDGVVNDQAAIQAALNAATNAGGGTVFVPPGTYKINSLLVLQNNVEFTGTGESSKIQTSGDFYAVSATNKNRAAIRNIYFYGTGSGDSNRGISLSSSTEIIVDNCIIENFGSIGIYLNSSNQCIIAHNIVNNNNYGIRIHGWKNVIQNNNVYDNTTDNIVELSGDNSNVVINNISYLSKRSSRIFPPTSHKRAWVSFTFDGGYGSFATTYGTATTNINALLFAAQTRGTFYIQYDRIDNATPIGGGHYLTGDELKTLYNYGQEIGSHTIIHPYLDGLTRDVVSMSPFKKSSSTTVLTLGKGAGKLAAFKLIIPPPATSEAEAKISKVILWLRNTGDLTGLVHCEIWSDSGGYPNAKIGDNSTSLDASLMVTSAGAFYKATFTFNTPIARSYGTNYWCIINTSAVSGTNTLYLAIQDSTQANHYPNSIHQSIDGGTTWPTPTSSIPIHTVYDVSSNRQELQQGKQLLTDYIHSNVDKSYQCRSFAYPFGDQYISDEAYETAQELFESARGAAEHEQYFWGANDLRTCDPYNLKAFGLDQMLNIGAVTENEVKTGMRMLIEAAKAQGQWLILFAHGWETEGLDILDKLAWALDVVTADSEVDIVTISEGIAKLQRQRRNIVQGKLEYIRLDDKGRLRKASNITQLDLQHSANDGVLLTKPAFHTHFVEQAAGLGSTLFANHYWLGQGSNTPTQEIQTSPKGIMRIGTDNLAIGDYGSLTYRLATFNTDDKVVFEAECYTGAITDLRLVIGLQEEYNDTSDRAVFVFDTDVHANNIYIETMNAASQTSQDSGIDLVQLEPFIFRIEITDRLNPQFYINGRNVNVISGNIFAGSLAASTTLKPYFEVLTRTVTSKKYLYIDEVTVWAE